MRLRCVLMLVLLCSVGAAASEGSPVLYPLGAPVGVCDPDTVTDPPRNEKQLVTEVYHAGDEHKIQQAHVLSFVPESRQFPPAKSESIAENDRQTAQRDASGVRLRLKAENVKNGVLSLKLKLSSKTLRLFREYEHRHTNLTPFLFAVHADGQAVNRCEDGPSGYYGGARVMVPIVEAGGSKFWKLRIEMASLIALVGSQTKDIVLQAYFSELQHGSHFRDDDDLPEFCNDPVLVKSNTIRLKHKSVWEPEKE